MSTQKTEVICEGECLDALIVDCVAYFFVLHEKFEDGVESKEKDYWREWIALVYPSFEGKGSRTPMFCLHHGFAAFVEILDVELDV